MNNSSRLRDFVQAVTALLDRCGGEEACLLDEGAGLLAALIKQDDWLPACCAQPHADHYQQYLLYCDPLERFSLLSFVWGPGQKTPVHDHTVWGLVGVMRGAERSRRYALSVPGEPMAASQWQDYLPGDVDCVSPTSGDIHEVANAYEDRVSISIHLYGANIGAVARHIYDPMTGREKAFVSGYSADVMPNIWDRSTAVRARLQDR